MILVDTSVWSLTLRRKPGILAETETAVIVCLKMLIEKRQVKMIGPIRQELLTGIKSHKQFDAVREALQGFRDEPITTTDYESAAAFSNKCLSAGIATTSVDLLICAVAFNRQWSVFSTDADFPRYARIIGIGLY